MPFDIKPFEDAPRPLCFTSTYKAKSNVLINNVSISKEAIIGQGASPATIEYKAIWDTGATGSVISAKVVNDLDLKPISVVQVHHGGGSSLANVYLVNIFLPNYVVIPQVRVTEAPAIGQAEVLIGMDIISQGDFAVTNKDGKTVFSFRIPSIECIDFVAVQKQEKGPKLQKGLVSLKRKASRKHKRSKKK